MLVLILDTARSDWAYINPYFGPINPLTRALNVVKLNMLGVSCQECRLIALTSYFHTDYPKIHVLMGLFNLGKLFKYAAILPRRVSYLERDFRHLCWRLCHALQIVNADYNLTHNFINENGYLTPGAVSYTHLTLPTNREV